MSNFRAAWPRAAGLQKYSELGIQNTWVDKGDPNFWKEPHDLLFLGREFKEYGAHIIYSLVPC